MRKPSTLLAESPIPLYLRVADVMRERIAQSTWPAGEQIPTLEALAQEFGVARVTVRQAVQLLTKESLLSPRRGLGTVVLKRHEAPKAIVMQTSLRALAAMYESTSAKILTFDESSRVPHLPDATGEIGSRYVFMRRVHFTEDQPYAVIALYLLDRVFRKAPDAFRTRAVIPELLKLKSVRIARASQVMRIGAADAETARLLRVPVGSAIALVTRVFLDQYKLVLYYAEVVYRGDWVKWEIELTP